MEDIKDEVRTIYQRLKPAQETLAKFNSLEDTMQKVTTKIALMEQKIDIVCEKLEQHVVDQKEQFSVQKDQISCLSKKIDDFIERSPEHFASRAFQNSMEKIGWAIGFLIIGAIAAAFFRLVLI